MKFAKYLATESVPEWRKKYLNYKLLKKLLKQIAAVRERDAQLAAAANAAALASSTTTATPPSAATTRNNGTGAKRSVGKQPSTLALPPPAVPLLSTAPSNQPDYDTSDADTVQILPPPTKPPASPVAASPRSSKLRRYSVAPPIAVGADADSNPIDRFIRRVTTPTRSQSPLLLASIAGDGNEAAAELDYILRSRPPEQRKFFDTLHAELVKIDSFYAEKEKEAVEKLSKLRSQIEIMERERKRKKGKHGKGGKKGAESAAMLENTIGRALDHVMHKLRRPASQSSLIQLNSTPEPDVTEYKRKGGNAQGKLEHAIAEYYRSLELIKNYKILNYTGFVKILKKFDKTAGWNSSSLFTSIVDRAKFQQSKTVDGLLHDTEELFITHFTQGRRQDGMRKLRMPDFKHQTHHNTSWRLGMYIGLSLPVLVGTFELLLQPEFRRTFPNYNTLIQIYAGFSIPIVFTLLFAVNLLCWSQGNINYRFVFEFDPRDNLDYHQFAEFGGVLVMLLSYTMYLTFSDALITSLGIQPMYMPLLLMVAVLVVVFQPLPIFYRSSRQWFVATLGRIITTPYFHVEFRDFFITDELNSLVYSIGALQLFSCSYTLRFDNAPTQCVVSTSWLTPVLAMLPAWWRLAQCIRRYRDTGLIFPHLVNAGKYSCSITVIWLSAIQNITGNSLVKLLWILASVVATCYTYGWDVFMDWGFLQPNSTNRYLRNELIYEWRFAYYWAMASNLVLRLTWVFTLSISSWASVGSSSGLSRPEFVYILAVAEMLRRFQWNFFRLENEHLNNCGMFRAIKEIPLPFQIVGRSSPAVGPGVGGAQGGSGAGGFDDLEAGNETVDEEDEEDDDEVDDPDDQRVIYVNREYDTKESYSRRAPNAATTTTAPQPRGHRRHVSTVSEKLPDAISMTATSTDDDGRPASSIISVARRPSSMAIVVSPPRVNSRTSSLFDSYAPPVDDTSTVTAPTDLRMDQLPRQ